ncbi:MAG: S-adenosylmethionine:tRNA ribosyltransferase-isomerase, partial [Bdellovibrionales bacterium]|nr:S-adenosylmethionine:tRNA ribosyltransferase-isomerase [Bdellovibrionales bacterium]
MKEIIFDLPSSLIALKPTLKRDHCKLLVYDRQKDQIFHRTFSDIVEYLQPQDHLVLNHARVSPRRLYWMGPKKRKQEIVFLSLVESHEKFCVWDAIVSGKNLEFQKNYVIDSDLTFRILERREKLSRIEVNCTLEKLETYMESSGLLPIPPYIMKARYENKEQVLRKEDREDYQTVFAKKEGASAAPTAGLHFTSELLEEIEKNQTQIHSLFLEVGWGTFSPLTYKNFETKKLHEEYIEIDKQTTQALYQAKQKHEKIVAVGTTVVRTLETWASLDCPQMDFRTLSDLFILPPFKFQVIDQLVTNFHLPQ